MKRYVAEQSQSQEVRDLNELKGVHLSFFYRLLFKLKKWW